MKRILVAMLMVLMSMPSSAWAQICLGPYSGAKFNAKPFNPAVGVKFYIDPNIFAYDPLL